MNFGHSKPVKTAGKKKIIHGKEVKNIKHASSTLKLFDLPPIEELTIAAENAPALPASSAVPSSTHEHEGRHSTAAIPASVPISNPSPLSPVSATASVPSPTKTSVPSSPSKAATASSSAVAQEQPEKEKEKEKLRTSGHLSSANQSATRSSAAGITRQPTKLGKQQIDNNNQQPDQSGMSKPGATDSKDNKEGRSSFVMGIFSKKEKGSNVVSTTGTPQRTGSRMSSEGSRKSGEFLLGLKKAKAMKAVWNGEVIAQHASCECYDGTFYFPPESLKAGIFTESEMIERHAKHGVQKFYNISVNGQLHTNCAFYFPDPPLKDAARIKGYVAFWKGVPVTPLDVESSSSDDDDEA